MKYLVTGVAGFIGSHIAEELIKDKNNVVVGIDNFYSGKKENIDLLKKKSENNFIFLEADIRDNLEIENIFKTYKIEYVFHQAAIASVQCSMEDPSFTNLVNVQGTLNILESSRKTKVKKIVFASSAAVYGAEPTLPKDEDSIVKPISPYGLEKYICEEYLELYSSLYDIECVALRYFNVYGERQDPNSEYSGVISIFDNKIKDKQSITIFGDGTQYRDFIYVKDVVKANLNAMKYNTGKFNIFCVGTGIQTSINELVDVIQEKYHQNINISYRDSREGDIKASICDNKKTLKELKLFMQTVIRNGIKFI